ncbi:AbiV family abortive infection protein [Mucilaginibacter sp. HMF5004]|uniref:AbiV family abortive infection protein n=1 Tax=Mucilaginibacter rivuli TaxID=2857527 RepID=UPI001C5E1FCF|nr:AbiV family abortive infection protein [Mucilaginibacter rivuli]MBW4888918.1 AbiV family abortive infection protein [Mucilaginibacter rivuli]
MVPTQSSSNIKNRRWSDLTFVEFEPIYPVIELNAKRHFNCANILAEAGEYQNGIAHLILGTEELIKAFGCLLNTKNFGIKNQPWFGKLFSSHKIRHDLIKDFFSIYLLFNFSSRKAKERSGFWAIIGNAVLNVGMATGNYLWWKKADDLKQRAFYVDYCDGIVDPADIKFADYERASTYVRVFEQDVTKLMREIESASPNKLKQLEKDLDLKKMGELRKRAYDLEKQLDEFNRVKNDSF